MAFNWSQPIMALVTKMCFWLPDSSSPPRREIPKVIFCFHQMTCHSPRSSWGSSVSVFFSSAPTLGNPPCPKILFPRHPAKCTIKMLSALNIALAAEYLPAWQKENCLKYGSTICHYLLCTRGVFWGLPATLTTTSFSTLQTQYIKSRGTSTNLFPPSPNQTSKQKDETCSFRFALHFSY